LNLGLDLGLKTGWSVWHGDEPAYGTMNWPSKPQAARFLQMHLWLDKLLRDAAVTRVVFEEPGGSKKSLKTFQSLLGLRGVVLMTVQHRQVDAVGIYPSQLKKLTTGSGTAGKNKLIKHAEAYIARETGTWPVGMTDDEADAVCLMILGREGKV
jgi:Holliday junction resolvasome RuvABC endonuclease subunit